MIVLYILLGIILVLLVISLLMPSKYMVEKTIIINTRSNRVIDYIADLNKY